MILSTIDWAIVVAYFLFVLVVGVFISRQSGKSTSDFFLSSRNMPWWLLGISMVATTFAADTPNLVTGLVRENGVAGNWAWWAFLLTGMLTVFVYAKLWRRSMVLTDVEFYELRYSGKAAAFLRLFRALYLGLIFNVLVMGAVSLAAIKFGEIVLGLKGWMTLLIAGTITIIYSAYGGLKAVIVTDFVQFILAMVGSICACIYIVNLDDIGGLQNLVAHQNVVDKISILPDFNDPSVWIPVLLVPLSVQWWASYYPGSEPGGGGYIAQRMFSAKDEKNAIGATLLYNVAHYALRPWPWILIALASLIIFPDVNEIKDIFPALSEDKIGQDIAYPAMLTLLPKGLLGLVAASLIAAFMSTMSTQLNLGASYLVNDVYHRFLNSEASEKQLVLAGRIFTLISAILGLGLGLLLKDATQAFTLMLLLGAGTGLIYILRWFWWRINAWSEIIAMIASLVVASFFTFYAHGLEGWQTIIIGVIVTTVIWILACYLTPNTDEHVLLNFYQKIRPGGWGWSRIREDAKNKGITVSQDDGHIPLAILCVVIGCVSTYALLFATGNLLYANLSTAIIQYLIAIAGIFFLFRAWNKLSLTT